VWKYCCNLCAYADRSLIPRPNFSCDPLLNRVLDRTLSLGQMERVDIVFVSVANLSQIAEVAPLNLQTGYLPSRLGATTRQ